MYGWKVLIPEDSACAAFKTRLLSAKKNQNRWQEFRVKWQTSQCWRWEIKKNITGESKLIATDLPWKSDTVRCQPYRGSNWHDKCVMALSSNHCYRNEVARTSDERERKNFSRLQNEVLPRRWRREHRDDQPSPSSSSSSILSLSRTHKSQFLWHSSCLYNWLLFIQE